MHTVHLGLVVLDLAVLFGSAALTVGGAHRRWAWVLLIASGAWLPLNNGVLEGPVLVALIADHGLTLSDLLGIGGAVLAGLRLRPRGRRGAGRWLLASAGPVVVVLVIGFLLASFVTDVRVDERQEQTQQHPHRHHHLHRPSHALLTL